MNFQSKENRDVEAARLEASGYKVSKGSSRNVLLSPRYVKDYDMATAWADGFGGYQVESFSTIYTLTVHAGAWS